MVEKAANRKQGKDLIIYSSEFGTGKYNIGTRKDFMPISEALKRIETPLWRGRPIRNRSGEPIAEVDAYIVGDGPRGLAGVICIRV